MIGLDAKLCKCSLSWPEARTLGNRLKKAQEDRQRALNREGVEKAVSGRTMKFIQENLPEYFTDKMPPMPDRNLAVSDICGTYELCFTSRGVVSTARNELVVSSDCKSLWGRFRIGDLLHGLVRTNRIPKRASTEPVQCQVAVQHPDGLWLFDLLRENSSTTVEGIIFLGNGLIFFDPACFASADGVTLNAPIFGIKTSQEGEDMDALRESWFAVHDSICACTDVGPEADDNNKMRLHCAWKPVAGGENMPWDEGYVDRLIDRLRSPVPPQNGST